MLHQPNKLICTGRAAGGEARRESSDRISRNQGHDPIAKKPQLVDAGIVQPISHATKTGDSWGEVWPFGKDGAPGVPVRRSRRSEAKSSVRFMLAELPG